jgi:SAM-dependent methyltransferase
MTEGADPDGFAVFGQFPHGFLRDVLRLRLLGDVKRSEVLHVCSGTLSERERWTVDIRITARPSVVAKGQALPFAEASFGAVLIDPPYTEEYARNLYRSEFPRPSHLLREAARVVKPGGRIGLLHIAVPITPDGCDFVQSFGVVPGPGFRIRAFTTYERQCVPPMLEKMQ